MTRNEQSYGTAFFRTLLLCAAYIGLGYIPLPTMGEKSLLISGLKNQHVHEFNIVMLHLTPMISGFFFAEFLSLFANPFRSWRLGGVEGRDKINQWAWGFSVLFSAIQGLGSSYLVLSFMRMEIMPVGPMAHLWLHAMNVAGLMGGTFIIVWLATLITRYGVGNGFIILFLVDAARRLFGNTVAKWGNFSKLQMDGDRWLSFDVMTLLLAATVFFIWKYLKEPPVIAVKRENGREFLYEVSPFPSSSNLQDLAISVLTMVSQAIVYLGASRDWQSVDWLNRGPIHVALECGLMLPIGWVLFNWLFSEMEVFGTKVGNLREYLKKEEKLLNEQALKSIVVLVVGNFVFWIPFWGGAGHIYGIIAFTSLIFIMATIQDLCDQWRFWREWGEGKELVVMDNVHLASFLKGLFQSEGIPVYIQAYAYRRLLFVFRPLFKMRLLVPDDRAAEAKVLLEKVKFEVV